MKYSKVYIKQASTHVAGHVFEHVVANFIQENLFTKGYLKLLDYRFGLIQMMALFRSASKHNNKQS